MNSVNDAKAPTKKELQLVAKRFREIQEDLQSKGDLRVSLLEFLNNVFLCLAVDSVNQFERYLQDLRQEGEKVKRDYQKQIDDLNSANMTLDTCNAELKSKIESFSLDKSELIPKLEGAQRANKDLKIQVNNLESEVFAAQVQIKKYIEDHILVCHVKEVLEMIDIIPEARDSARSALPNREQILDMMIEQRPGLPWRQKFLAWWQRFLYYFAFPFRG